MRLRSLDVRHTESDSAEREPLPRRSRSTLHPLCQQDRDKLKQLTPPPQMDLFG
jgi:hypothetical protein